MLDRIKNTIDKKRLIRRGDKVLVCVSGGADSMALLRVLLELQRHYGVKLVVAHLDHMIRGRSSAADANFVKKCAARLGLPFIYEKSDVRKTARGSKASLEEAARETRYDFYARAAERAGANKIATGHTADDQAETVLMRLVRGAGSVGLSGIPYSRRTRRGVVIIRPLLDVGRKDIERYLKACRVSWRTDATNLKTAYLRNKIRHILIPLIEKKFNPRIKENLNSIAENLRDESDYLDAAAARLYRRLVVMKKGRAEIGIRRLLRLHPAMRRLLVRRVIHSIKGNLKRITYRHWLEIEGAFCGGGKGTVNLPGGIKARRTGGVLSFIPEEGGRKRSRLTKAVKLRVPGNVAVPELGLKLTSEIVRSAPRFRYHARDGGRRRGGSVEYIDGDKIGGALKIRTRRDGDRMRPLGMRSYKKLHDIFVDEKVPRELRDRVPVVTSGRDIVWLVKTKLAEDFKVRKETKKIVRLAAIPVHKK